MVGFAADWLVGAREDLKPATILPALSFRLRYVLAPPDQALQVKGRSTGTVNSRSRTRTPRPIFALQAIAHHLAVQSPSVNLQAQAQ